MKVYLEAIDPENRAVRLGLLRKKLANLKVASGMAKDAGKWREADRLKLKSIRVKASVDRNKDVYKVASKKYKLANLKGSGVDREDRALRINKLKVFAKEQDKVDTPGERRLAHAKQKRAQGLVRAYSGSDPSYAKLHHGAERHSLQDQHKFAKAKALSTQTTADRIKPGLRSGSKIDKTNRAQRILDLVNAGNKSKEARFSWMRGDYTGATLLGVQGKSKRVSNSDGQKTSSDHAMDAQRAHLIAAKLMKTPGRRGLIKKALTHLRKGQSLVGRGFGKAFDNPLRHIGVNTDR